MATVDIDQLTRENMIMVRRINDASSFHQFMIGDRVFQYRNSRPDQVQMVGQVPQVPQAQPVLLQSTQGQPVLMVANANPQVNVL